MASDMGPAGSDGGGTFSASEVVIGSAGFGGARVDLVALGSFRRAHTESTSIVAPVVLGRVLLFDSSL